MISYDEALEQVLNQAETAQAITTQTSEAYGKILAESLYAPMALPSFHNSAMDGFAVCAENTLNASKLKPIWFDKMNTLGAGEAPDKIYQAHQATEIMTGAPLPEAFDAVVPVEKTQSETLGEIERIGITVALKEGENIRYRGEDIDEGQLLLSQGTRLTHEHIMTLSGLGIQTLKTFKPPHVLILATGKELSVDKRAKLSHQIYDCNSPYLASCLRKKWDATVHIEHLLTDTPEPFCERIQHYISAYPELDMICSTGAVSAGKYDFIPKALHRMKAETLFHKVAIRPGKPVLFAKLPNGTAYLGLPGNPSAVACGRLFFIEPLLQKQRLMSPSSPISAVLEKTVSYQKPLCFFLKAYHFVDNKGISRVKILSGQESFKISPFLKANSWVKVDKAPTTIHQGEQVTVYPMAGR